MEGSASHGEHAAQSTYPLRVEAELDSHVSRWLWLVKWVLVIPHVIALVFLWIAFVVLTVVAFFAIVFTGRYPPFTLAEAPGYPATAVPRRRRVRRRRVAGVNAANDHGGWTSGSGLIGLLVCIAGIVLLFTGRYPRAIFDFVMGMNRWCFRVAAYATLMTDAYPPFRLDMGGQESAPDS